MNRFNSNGADGFSSRALDIPGYSGNGAAGPYSRYHEIDAAVGIFPNLRARGLEMDFRIGRIFELLRHIVSFGIACYCLFGFGYGTGHALGAFGQNQFRAKCFQHAPALE